ncbi:MAG: hypothetical protein U0234_22925 [Sandaracinus sp.]
MTADDYDERTMFGALFPLVAAWPTLETVAAVMPAGHPLADVQTARRERLAPPAGYAVRRRTTAPWSHDNAEVVRIPDELLDAHAAEVADVIADPPARGAHPVSTHFAPLDEHRDAQLSLLRRRFEVDPVAWASRVAQIDERSMIALAEHTRDWAPWTCMIQFALSLRELDESNLVLRAAEHRLRLIARRMLDAMTLTDVRVDDTLAVPPMMQRALVTLFDREAPPP